MTERGLFDQTVIAVIWDFDKTLSPHYMQKPLFEAYGVNEEAFWREVQALPAYYERAGIRVHPDTCYLGHLLSYVRHGVFEGLTNEKLAELGAAIRFFPGIPGFFGRLAGILDAPEFRLGDLQVKLEHYVVSTGLAAMVRGSSISSHLAGVWASEFIEEPAGPGTDLGGVPGHREISHIATFLDNTTKTRALFEINKGVNKNASITVNDMLPEEERRVPFKNMIYIADGPSDIPSFSVVKKHGGLAYAVYDPDSQEQYNQVSFLHDVGRVHMFGPADYQPGSPTDKWLRQKVRAIASRILGERKQAFDSKVERSPVHIPEKAKTADSADDADKK